jgi:hypothetical protein
LGEPHIGDEDGSFETSERVTLGSGLCLRHNDRKDSESVFHRTFVDTVADFWYTLDEWYSGR